MSETERKNWKYCKVLYSFDKTFCVEKAGELYTIVQIHQIIRSISSWLNIKVSKLQMSESQSDQNVTTSTWATQMYWAINTFHAYYNTKASVELFLQCILGNSLLWSIFVFWNYLSNIESLVCELMEAGIRMLIMGKCESLFTDFTSFIRVESLNKSWAFPNVARERSITACLSEE